MPGEGEIVYYTFPTYERTTPRVDVAITAPALTWRGWLALMPRRWKR